MPSKHLLRVVGIAADDVLLAQLHGFMCSILDRPDSHHVDAKPWSVGMPTPAPRGFVVEVRLLHDEFEALFHDLAERRDLRIGGRPVAAFVEGLIEKTSWDELSRPRNARSWRVQFDSPVTFKNGNRSSPMPIPATMLKGIGSHWQNIAAGSPPKLLTGRELATPWISDIRGGSQHFPYKKLHVSAFVGTVRIVCDDPSIAPTVDRLLRFAEYAGVGARTAHGFGSISLDLNGNGVETERR